MPMRRDAYPSNWKEISLAIRERDGWKCQHCGLPNRTQIIRSKDNPDLYIVYDDATDTFCTMDGQPLRMSEIPDEFDVSEQPKRVVLTVHHIGATKDDGTAGDRHDKMDVRECNLVSLCNRCHFLADLDIHIANAAVSRKAKKDERKQKEGNRLLFAEW